MYGIAKLLTQDRKLMDITTTIDELTAPIYPQEVRVKR
jgi:hypothetical protein